MPILWRPHLSHRTPHPDQRPLLPLPPAPPQLQPPPLPLPPGSGGMARARSCAGTSLWNPEAGAPRAGGQRGARWPPLSPTLLANTRVWPERAQHWGGGLLRLLLVHRDACRRLSRTCAPVSSSTAAPLGPGAVLQGKRQSTRAHNHHNDVLCLSRDRHWRPMCCQTGDSWDCVLVAKTSASPSGRANSQHTLAVALTWAPCGASVVR